MSPHAHVLAPLLRVSSRARPHEPSRTYTGQWSMRKATHTCPSNSRYYRTHTHTHTRTHAHTTGARNESLTERERERQRETLRSVGASSAGTVPRSVGVGIKSSRNRSMSPLAPPPLSPPPAFPLRPGLLSFGPANTLRRQPATHTHSLSLSLAHSTRARMHARAQELPLDLVCGAGFVGAFGLALPSTESATGTATLQAQRTLDALRHIQYHKYTKRKNTRRF